MRTTCYLLSAPPSPEGKEANAVMKLVTIDGQVGPKTIAGIEAFQGLMKTREPGTVVDGRVSVANGYRYGGGYFTIVALQAFIRRHFSRAPCMEADLFTGLVRKARKAGYLEF
jgi:hypothetical protein